MIYITEKAANAVKRISDEEGVGYYIVRIKVLGGGCAGMTHDLFFDDQISETDEITEFDNIKIVIDALSFQYLDEATIDYAETDFEKGFKIKSPNIKSECGCGKSVQY